jgi:hypothetical protein
MVATSGAYVASTVQMSARVTWSRASSTRDKRFSGKAACNPFLRRDSGIPQLGHPHGSARTMPGCMGQKNSAPEIAASRSRGRCHFS